MAKKKCENCENKLDEAKFTTCKVCCEKYQGDYCNKIEHANIPIINGILAYVRTYYSRCAPMQIKMAVSSYYTEIDVQTAKRLLLETVQRLEIDVGDAVKDRQNSPNRSAKEAMLDDILCIFRIMDEAQLDESPVFCAADLANLPPTSPEAGGNLMSLFDIIARQEKMIQDLVASTASLRADVSALQNGPPRSYASSVAAAAIPGPSTGIQLQQRQQMTNKRQQVQNRPQENDNSGTLGLAAENDSVTDPTNDGYQTVQKKKFRSQPL